MDTIRIGKKIIDRKRIDSVIESILELRSQGLSQQQVADQLGLHRPFVSRVEKIGELRRGSKIAVLAFPIANKQELINVLNDEGIDYYLVMTDVERWDFIGNKNGVSLFNDMVEIIAKMRTFDIVIVIGSNYRIKLSEALLDKEVIGVEIGKSPIEEDRYVDVENIRELIKQLINDDKNIELDDGFVGMSKEE